MLLPAFPREKKSRNQPLPQPLMGSFFWPPRFSPQPPPQAPKPAPELERLKYSAGNWTSDSEMKASPFGPGGNLTSNDRDEWMSGGFFLVAHSDFKGAMGPGAGLALMGYNTEDKVYTYDAYNSIGEADHSIGTVSGDTWTWTNDQKMGGKVIKGKFIIKELSPTSYTFKYEMASETGEWSTIMEGKAIKK